MHRYFPILIHSYLPKMQHICLLVTLVVYINIMLIYLVHLCVEQLKK